MKIITIQLKDGVFNIATPKIKTQFCYGYSWREPNSLDIAIKRCKDVSEDAEAFIAENVRDINQIIVDLCKTTYIYAYKYNGVYKIDTLDHCQHYEEYRLLTFEEREEIARAYYKILQSLHKRLISYIKRYGTSKVKAWTYDMEE